MQKQKVFFFEPKTESGKGTVSQDDLREMAVQYVSLYGESCLDDPETPGFVREMMAKSRTVNLPDTG